MTDTLAMVHYWRAVSSASMKMKLSWQERLQVLPLVSGWVLSLPNSSLMGCPYAVSPALGSLFLGKYTGCGATELRLLKSAL